MRVFEESIGDLATGEIFFALRASFAEVRAASNTSAFSPHRRGRAWFAR